MKIDPKSQLSQNIAKSLLKNFKNQQVNFYPEAGRDSLIDKSMISQRNSMLTGGKSLKKLKLKPKGEMSAIALGSTRQTRFWGPAFSSLGVNRDS